MPLNASGLAIVSKDPSQEHNDVNNHCPASVRGATMTGPAIVWFRQDLRLTDNPALHAAQRRGAPVVPVFILAPQEQGAWAPGAASRWWHDGSLRVLAAQLQRLGSRLIVRRGSPLKVLREIARSVGADMVCWNRRYEPWAIQQEEAVSEGLAADGVEVCAHTADVLFEPRGLRNKAGAPFQVFTPFWKHCLRLPEPAKPLAAPQHLPAPPRWPESLSLDALGLIPRIDWAGGLRRAWAPGEAGALDRLEQFLEHAVDAYTDARDCPAREGVSRLSPHLHFGELSARQVWHAVRGRDQARGMMCASDAAAAYLRQLGWREFARYLLVHFPHTPDRPLRAEYADFPWVEHTRALRAWQQGRTGFPIVDAGMRELWHTGWMHNRVRMIAGSLLVKDLRIHWLEGARWFWDTLVDADLANNTLGWQWIAGCGADAAPYFRIFNPVKQGQRFDPDGAYVRRWVPELAHVPERWIHCPWEAPAGVLAKARVRLGENYPHSLVEHGVARAQALEAFKQMRLRAAERKGGEDPAF